MNQPSLILRKLALLAGCSLAIVPAGSSLKSNNNNVNLPIVSAFDGMWHVNLYSLNLFDPYYAFTVKDGAYRCDVCTVPYTIPADAQEHPIAGHPYKAVSVHVLDPKTVLVVMTRDHEKFAEITNVVSEDGQQLIAKIFRYSPQFDRPFYYENTYTRVTAGAPGSHASSGQWRLVKIRSSDTENVLSANYRCTGNGLQMSSPAGVSFSAKFDGKDYPVHGAAVPYTVSLRRVDDHTVEQTNKAHGHVLSVERRTVSPDGKTMNVVIQSPSAPDGISYTVEKEK
jgi:hypothetical protein